MSIVGIDLGTTNSLISVYKEGKSILIPNEFGDVLTPSVVSMDPNGKTVFIGKTAKERLLTDPEYTACQFKRSIGTKRKYQLGKTEFTSEELSSLVLRRLKEDAEQYLGEKVEEAVISVPAYFDDKQRSATKRAGELAGFRVERLVNEPSAAALMSRIEDMAGDKTILIFDFGGGTLDISYAECFDNVVNVVAISGNNQLGGTDFDLALAEYICFKHQCNFFELSYKENKNLLHQCEQLKIELSKKEEETVSIVLQGESHPFTLSRKKLVSISGKIFSQIEGILRNVFRDAEVEAKDIDEVILVGGSSKMPVVQQFLKYTLPEASIKNLASDTVVALGVGTYSGIKARSQGIRSMVLTDICPFSLGTKIYNEFSPGLPLMSVIINRNTPLPATRKEYYYTVFDYQDVVTFSIYQGENRYVQDNLMLGEVEIKIPSALAGKEAIEVTYAYDINGILIASIRVVSTDEVKELVFGGEGNLSEEERAARLLKMRALEIPMESDENKSIFDRAKRLLQDLDDARYYTLDTLYKEYRISLEKNSIIRQNTAKKNLIEAMNQIEGSQYGQSVRHFKNNWYDSTHNVIPFETKKD